jgi:hypothetical protein
VAAVNDDKRSAFHLHQRKSPLAGLAQNPATRTLVTSLGFGPESTLSDEHYEAEPVNGNIDANGFLGSKESQQVGLAVAACLRNEPLRRAFSGIS